MSSHRSTGRGRKSFLIGCLAMLVALPAAGTGTPPELVLRDPALERTLGAAYRIALDNLLARNTVRYDPRRYNKTGLLRDPPGTFIRAGGDYHTPWTRDASINSWNAASLLEPDVAENTLWAVCQKQDNGKLIIQRDNQWWDKVIWVTAAWSHFKITGNRDFLARAYEASTESLLEIRAARFNARYGLFEGPAVLADGIAGYPEPPYDPKVSSSFVLDHPGGGSMLVLSTNCVAYSAARCAASMARTLGRPEEEARKLESAAASLKKSIDKHFWIPSKGLYGYFIHGTGPKQGTLDRSQEGMGLAYAIIFQVAGAARTERILRKAHLQPRGVACVWPHFARFSDARPGRHNVALWPMLSGMWTHAAALGGRVDLLEREMSSVARMMVQSDKSCYEIYNTISGVPDGGWQCGRHWKSCVHQTWSATGFLRMVLYALFGMDFKPDGLRLSPCLPAAWTPVSLRGLRYRGMVLDISLEGSGTRVESCSLDGSPVPAPFVPADLTGRHHVALKLAE